MKLRIGTRGSDLALWQAHTVKGWLEAVGATVEIIVLETRGDRIDHLPLTKVEGKAFFTAERTRLHGVNGLSVNTSRRRSVFCGSPSTNTIGIVFVARC